MHKSQKLLTQALQKAEQKVLVGGLYVHYKNPELSYKVTGLAILEATDEVAISYQAQYGDTLTFVRPLTSWLETVEWQGSKVPRFSTLGQ